MTLSEIELALTEYELAAHYAHAAIQVAERLGETTNSGEAHQWLGRIAAAQSDESTTDSEFAIAFQKFGESRAADWQARSHAVYAEILEARGDLPAANHQLRLALAAIGPRDTVRESARIAIA